MKKFFALVLALVMAMSLTTMAWGAGGTYTYSGSNTGNAVELVTGPYDGVGATLQAGTGDYDAAIVLQGNATIKNVKIAGGTRGIESGAVVTATAITIDNVVVENCVRAIHINTAAQADLDVSDSTFEGKISFDLQGGTATFTNCTFKYDSALATGKGNIIDTYDSVIFENCVFDEGFMVNVFDLQSSGTPGATIEMNNCIYDGEPLTADNMDDLVVNIEDYGKPSQVVHAVPSGYVATPVYTATGTTPVDTKDAKTMAVKGAMVIEMVPAKAAYVETATGNWVGGWVKHYVDEYGVEYVPCTADVEGALIVYYKGTTSVYDTVVAANPVYVAAATEFTNFGTACGQYDNRGAVAGTKYYTVVDGNGVKALYQGTTATAVQVLVGDKLVGIVNTDLINALNAHKWVVEKNAKNEITKATCSLCGQPATWVLNMASIPTGAEFEPAPGGGYLYWSTAPVATEKPSTDKVTSAETFDAGIAMYVGMSVMAVAGSAVVIGKKKD